MVHFTLISCFSCHVYLSCKRFIWSRQHDIFGLLSAQETRVGSLNTFRSVVPCLQLICKCSRTQCKGNTLWRNHICLIVLEKHQLCWGGLGVVTDPRTILGSSLPSVNHVTTVSVPLGSKKFQRCACRYTHREILFPTVSRIVRLTPLPPFYKLTFVLHWMRQHLSCTNKEKGNLDATSVFAALNWWVCENSCSLLQQNQETQRWATIKKNPTNPGWSKTVPKALCIMSFHLSQHPLK